MCSRSLLTVFAISVEPARGANVEIGDQPGDQELREREEIRDVDRAPNFSLHEGGKIADGNREREVIHHEENRGGDDESFPGGEKLFEVVHLRDAVPH